jgi:hypothetical protein
MDKIINAEVISASGTYTSGMIDLQGWPKTANQKIGITAVVTGTGTAKLEYLVPTTETGSEYTGFIEPTGASDVGAGLTVGSYTAEFTPIQCQGFKLKVTETGGANSVTVTVYVVIK